MSGKPAPEALICVRCDEPWTVVHVCDLLFGDTLAYVVRRSVQDARVVDSTTRQGYVQGYD